MSSRALNFLRLACWVRNEDERGFKFWHQVPSAYVESMRVRLREEAAHLIGYMA